MMRIERRARFGARAATSRECSLYLIANITSSLVLSDRRALQDLWRRRAMLLVTNPSSFTLAQQVQGRGVKL